MPVDGVPFHYQFIRAQRNGHVNLAELPFHPGASVQPYVAFLEPGFIFELVKGFEYRFRADTVRAVRVGKVSCHIYLVRFHFLEKPDDDVYVFLGPFPFLYSAGLIERKVEEMGVGVRIQSE